MHVIFVIANQSSVPYFTWFADQALREGTITLSFVAMLERRPPMVDEMRSNGFHAEWIEFHRAKRRSGMVKACARLFRIFRRLQPDVVHTHLFDDSVPGLVAARAARVPRRVVTKQDTAYHWYYAHKWVWFDRLNNWNATHIRAVGSENRRFILEKERAPAHKVHLVRDGLPYESTTSYSPEDVEALRDEYGLKRHLVVGTVARFIGWKGHHLILDAAPDLIKQFPHVLFLWAGSDGGSGYKRGLEAEICARGLQKYFVIPGWVERGRMPALYRCMDIYLHPAIREPFGFAVAEALMNRRPVVATRTGATDLVEHGVHGYILKQNDSADIVDAVSQLGVDEARREALASAGHDPARDALAFQRMWADHLSLYRGD